MQRRLAAILAADVVDYSRLMAEDDLRALEALKQLREELFGPAVDRRGGNIFKSMGDGWLVEFSSVVSAVDCAVAIQEGLRENALIKLRIGVHIGDVVFDSEDIYGDGVNVAARLETAAQAGGILISDTAYNSLDGKMSAMFAGGVAMTLKNIARPIPVWHWKSATVATDNSAAASDDRDPEDTRPWIAVLPFDNMSTDREHEYFADGISEDIITALSKISRMRVIARNSTFAYKGRASDLRKVAEELGVRYVLEGSVRSGGRRLRITAQLIDASDGSHVWAERYDRTPEDLFDIQDEITKEIVTALQVHLTDGEAAAILSRGTNDIEAWQLCVRASELQIRFNATDYLEARSLAERAVARDPNYAYALATLGFTWWWDGRLGYTGDSQAKFERADEYARQAMAIDPSISWAIGLTIMVAAPLGRQEEALEIARRGFADQPGNADIRGFLGYALLHCARYEEALEHLRAAMKLNPFAPIWYRNGLVRALVFTGRSEEALPVIDDNLAVDDSNIQAWLMRGLILTELGRAAEAHAAVAEARRLAPHLRVAHIPGLMLIPDDDVTTIDMLQTGLTALGLPA